MYITTKFDSVAAFARYGEKYPTGGYAYSRTEGEADWYGTENYEEATELLKFGDRETAAKIEKQGVAKFRAALHTELSTIKTESSVVGFAPHVPNFIAGVPLSMISAKRIQQPAQAINVIYNCEVTCGVKAEDITRNSVKLFCAVMRLEASGQRVEMNVAAVIKLAREVYCSPFVRIKGADEKLNVLKCAYPLCNASFFRRQIFSYMETNEEVLKHLSDTYGTCELNQERNEEAAIRAKFKNFVMINYYDLEDKDIEGVIELIRERLK